MKPWPSKEVVLVCAVPDRANRAMMESTNPAECSDCMCDVVYDGRSMRKLQELERKTRPIGGGERPVKILCEACAEGYDVGQCDVIGDHTGGKDDIYAKPEWRGRL